MNRLVYLFELDPAKKGRCDAENAEFAIFNEIIKKGNKCDRTLRNAPG